MFYTKYQINTKINLHMATPDQAILERIASSDVSEVEPLQWDTLRDAIKHHIENNISSYLQDTQPLTPPRPFDPVRLSGGGLRLAPFPPRKPTQMILNETPLSYMDEQQANELKARIFDQLHEFEKPPFTIQRLCELCLYPRKQYRSVGKYLRAVEKSVLVTSSWDNFPVPIEEKRELLAPIGLTLSAARDSTPATPLFSPIPFLHDDPRRSKSRSPSPSPLALNSTPSLETKALGLVDELDDPGPGHLSDHPTALTAVTTVSEQGARPLIGSLADRFVSSEERHEVQVKMEQYDNSSSSKPCA